jgi:hypothetical protein
MRNAGREARSKSRIKLLWLGGSHVRSGSTRRQLRDPSFDAAMPRAVREPRMGANERDGDPVGVILLHSGRLGPGAISWFGLSSQALCFQALAVLVDRPLLLRVVGDRPVTFDCLECCIGLAQDASSLICFHMNLDAGKQLD